MKAKLEELLNRLRRIDDLESAASLLAWDQRSYMPPGGAIARARQISTLKRLAHEQFTSPAVGRLLDSLRPYQESLPYDSDDASLIRVTRRDYERATRIPAAFQAEYERNAALTYQIWTQAREADDFQTIRPYLEKTLDLSRRYSHFFPEADHIIDPLIDLFDEGITGADLRRVFGELKENLMPIARAIAEQPAPVTSFMDQHFASERQLAFGLEIAQRIGFDTNRGRGDLSAHPITTIISLDDVRITTRINENHPTSALFGTLHESGHAIYSQNIRRELAGTPLGRGATAGVHESQSRFWENLVGRSAPFWQWCYPRLQAAFPDQLDRIPLDTFYHAINQVRPGLFRVTADEVTYSLHCAMRFQLELDLLEGKVEVRDLPTVWGERFVATFGITPPNDRDGVLQEMNWYCGRIGGLYQHFTLGNIMSALWFELATEAHPEATAEMSQGEFRSLRTWLVNNIHTHGRKFTIPELVERVTGDVLTPDAYLRHLKTKYSKLYRIPFT